MVMLHAVLIFLVFRLLFDEKILFIAVEVLILISIGISWQLLNDFMQPIEFVRSGIEAIKEKDFSIKFVPTGKGEIDTLIEVYNLMIDQLREERTRLTEQHFFLEKLIMATPIAIVVLNFDEKISSMNEKAADLLKDEFHVLVGKTLNETQNPILQQLAEVSDGSSRIIRTNGIATYRVIRSHFMNMGFKRSFLIIEELTAELLSNEKMAYGNVIRMMAHEVNNTLGATYSILQTTINCLVDENMLDIREALRVSSDRNMRLTKFMRNFADVVRLPQPTLVQTNVNELVRDVSVFMESLAGRKSISIINSVENQSVNVNMDRVQMEQVLVNVIKNAVEACDENGIVKIALTDIDLTISNNGKAISADISSKLFSPFFSNKPDGQGIGLTLTRDILVNHGFDFSLKTSESGWTDFWIGFSA